MAGIGSTNATPLLQRGDSSDDNDDSLSQSQIETFPDDQPIFKSSEPRDKYSVAFLIFYFIGMTTLLPWNFFITADNVSAYFIIFLTYFFQLLHFSIGCINFEM